MTHEEGMRGLRLWAEMLPEIRRIGDELGLQSSFELDPATGRPQAAVRRRLRRTMTTTQPITDLAERIDPELLDVFNRLSTAQVEPVETAAFRR